MFKMARNNVNDRILNRQDNVTCILGSDVCGSLLYPLRCLMHQVCFSLTLGIGHPVTGGIGFKRYTYSPIPLSAARSQWWQRPATVIGRGVRSAG